MTQDTYRLTDIRFIGERARFYANCARVFGWPGWSLDPDSYQAPTAKPGRDGEAYDRVKTSKVKDESRNDATDALTWLAFKGKLNSEVEPPRTEQKLEIAWAEGKERQNTANRLQETFQLAELTPLRSADFLGGGGGSSFGSRHVGDVKLIAMHVIQALRSDIPPACMRILEGLLLENRFDWRKAKTPAAERRIYQDIRMALDFATWSVDRSWDGPNGEIDMHDKATTELLRRWPEAREWLTMRRIVRVTQSARRDRRASLAKR